MTEPIVFVGPTLTRHAANQPSAEESQLLAGFDVRPPVRRGDLLSAFPAGPLVILDGYYYTVPAVTHKEILYALRAGVRVIGAASMGALRAAELTRYGMIGVGQVFQWYRDGVVEGDDEVAVLHGPKEVDYEPITVALVEVRWALQQLVGRQEITRAEAEVVLDEIRAWPFTDRFLDRILDHCGEVAGPAAGVALGRELERDSVKLADARLALSLALSLARQPSIKQIPPPGAPTVFLNADREWHYHAAPGLELLKVWNVVQLLHPQAPELTRRLRLRWILATAARRAGLATDRDRRHEVGRSLRRVLRSLDGGVALAAAEIEEEAGMLVEAERAQAELGGVEGASERLADSFGLPMEDPVAALLAWLESSSDVLPSWWLGRSFLFCPAWPVAQRAARAIEEVHGAFRQWARGRRVTTQELVALAAKLWSCPKGQVAVQAARRGLFESAGPEPGWRDAMEWIAAAERLPRPINGYPKFRKSLIKSDILRVVRIPS